jgi:hypothetical protein
MSVLAPESVIAMARRAKLGRLVYQLYYRPRGFVQQCLREGPLNVLLDRRGRHEMERAAFRLPPLDSREGIEPLELHFLTGKPFWYQTCFCAYSFAVASGLPIRLVVYDDGTLRDSHRHEIRRLFPESRIVSTDDIQRRLDERLPAQRFPALRAHRLRYPHLRKLTDVHAGSQGWKLVLDSDMLFFREPTFLVNWLHMPDRPCHMVDSETSYGYTSALMTRLAGSPIAARVNVGVCGLNSDAFDWPQLEYWCATLIETEGTTYYHEQALVAMLVAGNPCAVAPADEYLVLPDASEVEQPSAVMHHYVANSKRWYFRTAWRHLVRDVAVVAS